MKRIAFPILMAVILAFSACSNQTARGQPPASPASSAPESSVPESSAPDIPAGAEGEEEPPPKGLALANKPVSPYWYPNDLLAWDPLQDPGAPYSVSTVPLAKRVDTAKLSPANATQNKDTKVVAISIMNASTSGNPTQGSAQFEANTFSYWQYIDTMVYWGGSAGEGLIVPPSPDVTDAAHRNGVPVLGTVFFPQEAHGGKLEWLDDFLARDGDGNYPIVGKLILAARTFGFDGWFINQETDGTTADHADRMRGFIRQLREEAGDALEIMWYDSMVRDGPIDWQNALTDQNACFLLDDSGSPMADSMFLNFWWTNEEYVQKELLKASAQKAAQLGLDPFALYAGVDVQANGTDTPIRWDLLEDGAGGTRTSLGLYCPSWTYFSSGSPEEFEEKENLLWVNGQGDPFQDPGAQGTDWRGVSTYAIEKSAVTAVPFVTHFGMGNGQAFYADGRKVSSAAWNNRSLADVAPTYRWRVEQPEGNTLAARIDYSDASYGGNSIRLGGKLQAGKPSAIRLYSADLPLVDGLHCTAEARADKPVSLDLLLGLDDGTTQAISGDKALGPAWATVNYDISGLAGKAVRTISLRVTAEGDWEDARCNLGGISITGPADDDPAAVSGLQITDAVFDAENYFAGVRLSWDAGKPGEARHYEIYRVKQDGTKTLVGATPNTCYYVDLLQREGAGDTQFEVAAVNQNFVRGSASIVSLPWPAISKPTADFSVSDTIVAPGQEIRFESRCSRSTESIKWEFPGSDTESSDQKAPSVRYEKEGTYPVRLTAANASGEDVQEIEGLITVTADAAGITNLSEGKAATASGFTNDNEAPAFAVDGDTGTKWCAVGEPPHEITIDLGAVKTICGVKIAHAEAGGESADMNTRGYTIEAGLDGAQFEEVAKITASTQGNTSDAFKARQARYIRLKFFQPTQGADTAARIYEIQVYGLG